MKQACLAIVFCSALSPAVLSAGPAADSSAPAVSTAAVKRINSLDRSFSAAAPEGWRPAFTEEGPVLRFTNPGKLIPGITLKREAAPSDTAVMAGKAEKELVDSGSCTSLTIDNYVKTFTSAVKRYNVVLRKDWPAAYAVEGECSGASPLQLFFSDGSGSYTANCWGSAPESCRDAAASVGPAVPDAESASVWGTGWNVLGLHGTLSPGICGGLNGFHKLVGDWLIISAYMAIPIPFIFFFSIAGMLLYQSLAAGALIALLSGWFAGRRAALVVPLLFLALVTGFLFSWRSAGTPDVGFISHGEACVNVAEGWIRAAFVLLAGFLGVFGRRLYEQRRSPAPRK